MEAETALEPVQVRGAVGERGLELGVEVAAEVASVPAAWEPERVPAAAVAEDRGLELGLEE